MLSAVIRQQWMILARDNRFRLLFTALLLASIAALAGGVSRNERWVTERTAAAQADAHAWNAQGETNPHHAAHFGHYVFKTVTPLSVLDPGLLDDLGNLLRLEAHKQSPASARPSDAGTALTRFGGFSAASCLQQLAPLLMILLGFTAFSGERARALLGQEIAAGIDPRVLMLGRLLALGAVIGGLLLIVFSAAGALVLASGTASDEFGKLVLMLAGYGLYLSIFLAVALGVSATMRSARSALTILLGFWVIAVLLVPAIGPTIAAKVYPTPSGAQLYADAESEIADQLNGDGPPAQRGDRITASILEKYGVTSVEDLPVSLNGAVLEFTEDGSTAVYRRHFSALDVVYARQARLIRMFALLSPLTVLRPWSAGLAGTDLAAHQLFLREAEEYRYTFVQMMNRDIANNASKATGGKYKANVAHLTSNLTPFRSSVPTMPEIWNQRWLDGTLLVIWFGLAVWFACWAAGRLQNAP